jgi:single-strand DNA-binding protein
MSLYLNQTQLTGRAGHDPELHYLTDGTAVLRLRLYQDGNKREPGEAKPSFYLVAWGGLAETFHQKVKRGSELFVQGKLRNRLLEYEGRKILRTEVHLDHFLLLASGRSVAERQQSSAL